MRTIAIQPDDYTDPKTPERRDASSPIWADLLTKAGRQVRWVDVYRADILEQLRDCHGFMWRYGHFGFMAQIARRLLPVLEREMGLVVYPNQNTCWHYDDKIAQYYLLHVLGLPVPRTWAWYSEHHAVQWAETASYPVVLKLGTGAGSTNVRLIESRQDAVDWIARLFGEGLCSLAARDAPVWPWRTRLRAAASALTKGRLPRSPLPPPLELQRNYALFQEFLPGNAFDTRVTVIGDRAFGFRRFNRPDDFRASGSGALDPDPERIDIAAVRLAFETARRLRSQSIAIDALRRGNDWVVNEVSYTYASWAVRACPGHWVLRGDSTTGTLDWQAGAVWPEEAQIEDYLEELER